MKKIKGIFFVIRKWTTFERDMKLVRKVTGCHTNAEAIKALIKEKIN